jgi:hypothetical protein
MVVLREIRYLPPPGAPASPPEPGRWEQVRRAATADAAPSDRRQGGVAAYPRDERRADGSHGRADRMPRAVAYLRSPRSPAIDPDAGSVSGFLAQRIAQERLRPGLFIDRSAQAARAYAARAGYAALRATVGGNVNVAV